MWEFLCPPLNEGLFRKVEDIKDKTSNFKSTILSGELDFEYHAPFIPAQYQIDLLIVVEAFLLSLMIWQVAISSIIPNWKISEASISVDADLEELSTLTF